MPLKRFFLQLGQYQNFCVMLHPQQHVSVQLANQLALNYQMVHFFYSKYSWNFMFLSLYLPNLSPRINIQHQLSEMFVIEMTLRRTMLQSLLEYGLLSPPLHSFQCSTQLGLFFSMTFTHDCDLLLQSPQLLLVLLSRISGGACNFTVENFFCNYSSIHGLLTFKCAQIMVMLT